MEDSTAMTVEFLRARLLAERSVSKSAKQRADELAQKVLELEEQIKLVTQPRKEAEKATEKEQVLYDSKDGNNSVEEENGLTSRAGKSEEDISGSEHGGSLLSGRSLSWKSCNDSPNSVEKKKYFELRRQCSFACTSDSSTRQRAGKSCRKIKQTVTIEAQPHGVAMDPKESSEILKDNSSGRVNIMGEGYLEDKLQETNAGLDVNGSERDTVAEIKPGNQVQLIDQYKAEENAQREWEEEKEDFKENTSCTPDSHGNQSDNSDVKEERDDIRGSEAKLETNSEFSFPIQENSGSIFQIEKAETPRVSSEEHEDGSQHSGESSSGIQNDLQIEIWREKPTELDSVLESLQRAKMALKQELNRSQPLTPGWPLAKIRETDGLDSMKIPNCYTGLFRVPTDLECKATTQPNFLPSLKPHYDPLIDIPTSSKFNYPSYAECTTRTPKSLPGMRSEMLNGVCPPIFNNHDRINMQHRF
ncbi:hypothetical protein ACHQM5_010184 [Ranunculus cassubicifolius]